MNATDQVTLAALQELATDGVAVVSVRRLAEIVGRSRETTSKSLWRLIQAECIERVKAGRGVQSGRYRVLIKPTQNPDNNRPLAGGSFEGVRDLFRSQDLYNAGQLFEAAPKGVPLSVRQIVDLGVTKSANGVRAQLMRLESLPAPLVSTQPDPSHRQRKLWMFQMVTPKIEAVNLAHLDTLEGRYQSRYRLDQELKHLNEQEANRARLGLESFAVVADRDIWPHVVEDPETGCLVFMDQDNAGGDYGRVHPKYLGIAVHRVVWIAERGPVPAGHELHHDCGVRPCVNVRHIRVLTRAQHETVHHGQTPAMFSL